MIYTLLFVIVCPAVQLQIVINLHMKMLIQPAPLRKLYFF